MKSAVWQHVDLAARKLTPFLFSLVLVVLNLVPLQLPGYSVISPNFALMAVYYWALHRPSLLPSGAVFLVGLPQRLESYVHVAGRTAREGRRGRAVSLLTSPEQEERFARFKAELGLKVEVVDLRFIK